MSAHHGAGHRVVGRQEPPVHGAVPHLGAPRPARRALQVAEHGAQLRRHARRRRDRPRPDRAGRGRARAPARRHEPDPAQARDGDSARRWWCSAGSSARCTSPTITGDNPRAARDRRLRLRSPARRVRARGHRRRRLARRGEPAEGELVNMWVAERADAPVVLVTDIERGGALAAIVGTLELLEPAERARVNAIVVNKFRGDRALFDDGVSLPREAHRRARRRRRPAPGRHAHRQRRLARARPRRSRRRMSPSSSCRTCRTSTSSSRSGARFVDDARSGHRRRLARDRARHQVHRRAISAWLRARGLGDALVGARRARVAASTASAAATRSSASASSIPSASSRASARSPGSAFCP